jgi:hypothetical protein
VPWTGYHQVLPARDGWAASGSGTTGGAKADADRQKKNIVFRVPSNTTIVGVPGTKAGITGGSLQVQNVKNIIVRNLPFAATEDCFPQWDPTDGSSGEWNSTYDSVTLRGATNVWADHNTFTDEPTFDRSLKTYFDRNYQIHDGVIHLYNNVYDTTTLNGFEPKCSLDSRAEAQVVAERIVWKLPAGAKVAKLLSGDGTGSVAGACRNRLPVRALGREPGPGKVLDRKGPGQRRGAREADGFPGTERASSSPTGPRTVSGSPGPRRCPRPW